MHWITEDCRRVITFTQRSFFQCKIAYQFHPKKHQWILYWASWTLFALVTLLTSFCQRNSMINRNYGALCFHQTVGLMLLTIDDKYEKCRHHTNTVHVYGMLCFFFQKCGTDSNMWTRVLIAHTQEKLPAFSI